MSRECTICRNPQVSGIDADLEAGLSVRQTAKKWLVSRPALARHSSHRDSPEPSHPAEVGDQLAAALEVLERVERDGSGLALRLQARAAVRQALDIELRHSSATNGHRELLRTNLLGAWSEVERADAPGAVLKALAGVRAAVSALQRANASLPADTIEVYVDPVGRRAGLPRGEDALGHYPWPKDSIVRHFGIDPELVGRATRIYIVPELQGNATISLQTESGRVLFAGQAPASGGW